MVDRKQALPVWFHAAFAISLWLVIYRLPLFALFKTSALSRLALSVPMLLLTYGAFKQKAFRWSAWSLLFLSAIFLYLLALVYFVGIEGVSFAEVNSFLASRSLFFMIPMLLVSVGFVERDYRRILNRLVPWVIVSSSAILIIETIGYRKGIFSPMAFQDFLTPADAISANGEFFRAATAGSMRPIGNFGQNASSAGLLGAAIAYHYARRGLHGIRNIVLFLGGFGALVLTSSSFSIAATVICIAVISVLGRPISRALLAAFGGCAAIAVLFSPLKNHLSNYLENPGELARFMPNLSDCTPFPLWGNFSRNAVCDPGEVNLVLMDAARFGLLPVLPWAMFILAPLGFLLAGKIRKRDASLLALWGVLFLAAFHFSTFEKWGVNYLVAFIVLAFASRQGRGKAAA